MSQETSQDTGQTATAAQDQVSNTNTTQDTADNQPARVYTQTELDAVAAEVRRKAEAKLSKKFEGIDVEHYKSLTAKEESEKISKAQEKSEEKAEDNVEEKERGEGRGDRKRRKHLRHQRRKQRGEQSRRQRRRQQTNERTNERKNERTSERANEQTNERTNERTI